ncbi:hypothetical protein [Granulicoccus phenolivorans]|uniref:hypothetical protein n=1 Tax=Granulicoccus phenolivorans TaxID=266854 RepID=UPI00041403EC|nr:hypothetical protein [Granulicoccus phenolivorans]
MTTLKAPAESGTGSGAHPAAGDTVTYELTLMESHHPVFCDKYPSARARLTRCVSLLCEGEVYGRRINGARAAAIQRCYHAHSDDWDTDPDGVFHALAALCEPWDVRLYAKNRPARAEQPSTPRGAGQAGASRRAEKAPTSPTSPTPPPPERRASAAGDPTVFGVVTVYGPCEVVREYFATREARRRSLLERLDTLGCDTEYPDAEAGMYDRRLVARLSSLIAPATVVLTESDCGLGTHPCPARHDAAGATKAASHRPPEHAAGPTDLRTGSPAPAAPAVPAVPAMVDAAPAGSLPDVGPRPAPAGATLAEQAALLAAQQAAHLAAEHAEIAHRLIWKATRERILAVRSILKGRGLMGWNGCTHGLPAELEFAATACLKGTRMSIEDGHWLVTVTDRARHTYGRQMEIPPAFLGVSPEEARVLARQILDGRPRPPGNGAA